MPVVPMTRPRGNPLRPKRPPVSPTFLAMAAATMHQERSAGLPPPSPDPNQSAAARSISPPAPDA